MALIVVSTLTVGAGEVGVLASVQLTVAVWAPVADATGRTSGIVPAWSWVLARSTARLLVVVVVDVGVTVPGGTDRVQLTSTRCAGVDVVLITACGYARTRYEDPAASDWVATVVALVPSVTADALV